MSTIFNKIINKEIEADIIYEDDQSLAFKDINAQAPIHFLIIPKKEIPSINEINDEDKKLIGHLFLVAKKIAKKYNINQKLINQNKKNKNKFINLILSYKYEGILNEIKTNPRYISFNQIYFHAGDIQQFERYGYLQSRLLQYYDFKNNEKYKIYSENNYETTYQTFQYIFNKFKASGLFPKSSTFSGMGLESVLAFLIFFLISSSVSFKSILE